MSGRILFSIVLCLALNSALYAQPEWDWLITGGWVVDGTGGDAFKADILIRGDSIGFIGAADADTIQAKHRADAAGRIITPGFIDVHAHGDPLETPEFRNFLAMGVTTILLGQDGSSPTGGPLADWFRKVKQAQPSVNIASLSGHGTLRSRAGVAHRAAGEQEVRRMESLLESDLQAGAFGMSTGLEYVPGLYADKAELVRLARMAGKYDAIVMSHMRSEDDAGIRSSLDELTAQGAYARVHVSHLKVVYGEGKERAEEILRDIDSLREKGIVFSADTYPYAASYTGIGIVFPGWAKTNELWQQAMNERPGVLRRYLLDKVKQRNGPDAILFGSGKYAGKTLQEAAGKEGKPYIELLLKMGPEAASAAHFVMDEELQDHIAVAPGVMISSDGSPTMQHPRGYGSFAKVIRRYVIQQQRLTIEEAVYKMSGLPAKTLGLKKRGIIKEGYKADLLVFDPEKVQGTATFGQPHQLAKGIDWIWINGRAVREAGQFKDGRFGDVLKKEDQAAAKSLKHKN